MEFQELQLMPGVRLRPMRAGDLDTVVTLERGAGGNCSRSLFLVRLSMPSFLSFVVEQRGIVAFGVLLFKGVEADGVKLVSNGSGAAFAAHALKALKPVLRALGAERLVGRCKPALLRYYQGLGFTAVGTLPRFFGSEDAVALEQKL